MKKARILAAFLAALALLPVFASCASENDPKDTDVKQTTVATEDGDETVIRDTLPDDLNYNGNKVTILSRNYGSDLVDEVYVEELRSDPVNDAVYERNKEVEERLGIKINSIRESTVEPINEIITAINGGSSDYDIMVELSWKTMPKSIEGYFADLRKTEYLDFEKPWWTQGFNEAASYHDSQFAVTGTMVLSTYRRTYTTVFNKRLFTDANQKYLYEYVEDGSWTLDTQIALVPVFHQDNGNNIQDESGDIYGFVSDCYISIDPYQTTAELEILRKDEYGDYEWAYDNERIHDLTEKVLQLYYGTDNGMYVAPGTDFQEATRGMFADGYAAMATLCLQALEHSTMRNMADEYGVVPIPKFDKTVTTYHSAMHDGYTVAVIPTTVTGERLDQMRAVLEAMGSASYRIIKPAYYELTLRTKLAKDPQSAEMMDLIINGIVIDPGIIYSNNMDGFHAQHRHVISGKTNNATSHYKSLSNIAQKRLRTIINKLNRITGR
ncbi:MAG: hypothetical protein E7610_03435 [Ruminococcaceae bacterium]|nr:hypothetical protein [Oscillospiraceae bacterium]